MLGIGIFCLFFALFLAMGFSLWLKDGVNEALDVLMVIVLFVFMTGFAILSAACFINVNPKTTEQKIQEHEQAIERLKEQL